MIMQTNGVPLASQRECHSPPNSVGCASHQRQGEVCLLHGRVYLRKKLDTKNHTFSGRSANRRMK